MRPWHRIPILLPIWLVGFAAPGQPTPCPEAAPLVAKLRQGETPGTADYPNFAACGQKAYAADLGRAVAVFAKKTADPQRSLDTARVIAAIRKAHEDIQGKDAEEAGKSYRLFAKTLQASLTEPKFTIPLEAQRDGYTALDSLVDKLTSSPVIPAKPCAEIEQDVAHTLKAGALQVGFIPPAECLDAFYMKLGASVASQVSMELRRKTLLSRIGGIVNTLKKVPSGQQKFAARLREQLDRPESSLPSRVTGAKSDSEFLSRLLDYLNPPPPPPWWQRIAAWLAFLGFAMMYYAIHLYLVRRRTTKSEGNLTESVPALTKRVYLLETSSPGRTEMEGVTGALSERLRLLDEQQQNGVKSHDELKSRIDGIEAKLPPTTVSPSTEPVELSAKFEALARRVGVLDVAIREVRASVPESPIKTIPLEREILGETWKKFGENKELLATVENAAQDSAWQEINGPLLDQLPKCVPDDLKATFDAILAPARDYHNLVSKISTVRRLANDELPRLGDAQELARLREFTILLTMAQNSNLVADRLDFRLKPWIADHFLTFADLFLQKYQLARLDGKEASLEAGLQIVLKVLGVAGLQPIELTLGKTPFDSSQHIGRSTTCDSRFSDGAIMAAVRNGFIQGGQQVIRQPEVIVNRLR